MAKAKIATNLQTIDLLVYAGNSAIYVPSVPVVENTVTYQEFEYDFSILIPVNSQDGKIRYILAIDSIELVENRYFIELRKKLTFKSVLLASSPAKQFMQYGISFILAVLLFMSWQSANNAADSAKQALASVQQVQSQLSQPLNIQLKDAKEK